jgi:hypothetical protein
MSCDLEIWFGGSLECSKDKGKVLIVISTLYGLESAGASWRSLLVEVLVNIGFHSMKADLDICICSMVCDGFEYYEMLFVFVNIILALSHKAKDVIMEITKFFKAKDRIVKPPDINLGSNVMKVQLGNGHEVWAISLIDYVKNAIAVVEHLLDKDGEGYSLENKAKNPFPSNYRQELDVTNELGESLALHYMQLIGILRWAVELG